MSEQCDNRHVDLVDVRLGMEIYKREKGFKNLSGQERGRKLVRNHIRYILQFDSTDLNILEEMRADLEVTSKANPVTVPTDHPQHEPLVAAQAA